MKRFFVSVVLLIVFGVCTVSFAMGAGPRMGFDTVF